MQAPPTASVATRLPWVSPLLEQLPRLTELTLTTSFNTGEGGGGVVIP